MVRVEEVVSDELSESATEHRLPPGDDGCVRYRHPERMAEKGRDGEPIGRSADHSRLGSSPQISPETSAIGEELGCGEDDRRTDQKPGGRRRRAAARSRARSSSQEIENVGAVMSRDRRGRVVPRLPKGSERAVQSLSFPLAKPAINGEEPHCGQDGGHDQHEQPLCWLGLSVMAVCWRRGCRTPPRWAVERS